MQRRTKLNRFILVLICCGAGAAFCQSSPTQRPSAPQTICVESRCTTAPAPLPAPPPAAVDPVATTVAPSRDRKWTPGHYVRPDEKLYPKSAAERRAVYDTTRNVGSIRGALILIPWGMVEPVRAGEYDWRALDADIAYLAGMNKMAILEFSFRAFGGQIPQTPQGEKKTLPDYILQTGCVGRNTDDVGGYSARLDLTRCMDRYIALIEAVAARYDTHPAVEHVVLSETSVAISASDFSYSRLYAEQQRMLRTLADAFEYTHVSIMNNFMNAGTSSAVAATRDYTYSMIGAGVGLSVPDILSKAGGARYDNWNALTYRGAGVIDGQDHGSSDRRGAVPMVAQQQVIHSTGYTPANIYGHASQYYQATHIVWNAHGGSWGATALAQNGSQVPAMTWLTGVLPYLKANSLPVQKNCPTTFYGRCKSGN